MMPRHSRTSGFTLIELLVVIAIIGILSSAVLASVSISRQKARDAKRIAELSEIKKALEIYRQENDSFPPTTPSGYSGATAMLQLLVARGLLPSVPTPPLPSTGYIYYGTNEAAAPSTDCATTEPCAGFVLGVTLERNDAPVLLTDSDVAAFTPASGSYNGAGGDCLAAGAQDLCYDIMQ